MKFFKDNKIDNVKVHQSLDMKAILSQIKPGGLVIFDIDDTISRVSQTIGLDAWFRFRIVQFANEGDEDALALFKTIEIYNLAQLASQKMVAVDENIHIAQRIARLKEQGVKVIALTARNHELTAKTLDMLAGMGVHFSQDVLNDGQITLDNKLIDIKEGVIFANGTNKGTCFNALIQCGIFIKDPRTYSHVSYVDDSYTNCLSMASALNRLLIEEPKVWHYTYAETHLKFNELDIAISSIQEKFLLEEEILLSDEQAREIYSARQNEDNGVKHKQVSKNS